MNLGSRIRRKREELNISQEELAKKLGYKSRSTINKIEMGKNDITQHKIVAFAEALHTTPTYLLGLTSAEAQKKNDAIADTILRLRSDEDFLQVVTDLQNLTPEQLLAVKNFLVVFKK